MPCVFRRCTNYTPKVKDKNVSFHAWCFPCGSIFTMSMSDDGILEKSRELFNKYQQINRDCCNRISSDEPRTRKRENFIDWDTYFMATAFLARHRSKDPDYQVGACIVDDQKKIVGIGWNGRPTGVPDDAFTWAKGEKVLDNKHTYVCHAEANAIMFRTSVSVKDCIMYVTLLPCNECAKSIIQSGIKKVYYFCEDKTDDRFKATKPMFEKADVDYKELKPKIGKIDLTFSSENLKNMKM